MATKPTERIPDWASSGTRTDPGAGKEASGWAVSERPPAEWWNWLLGSFGGWLGFQQEVMAPYMAYSNLQWTTTEPWGTIAPVRTKSGYVLGRHYLIQVDNSNVVTAYDSLDGVTWSSGTAIDTGSYISRFVTDGSYVYVASEGSLFRSSTGLASGFTEWDALPAICSDLVYDDTNGLFITAYTDNIIRTSTDGLSWTTRATGTDDWTFMDHDPTTGTTVAQDASTANIWFTTDGTTWTERTSPATVFIYGLWSEGANCWVLRNGSTGQAHAVDTATLTQATPAVETVPGGIECDAVIDTPEFCLIWSGQTGTATTQEGWYALKSKAQFQTVASTLIYLGGAGGPSEVSTSGLMATRSCYRCGNGVIYWQYDGSTGDYIAYSEYGPSV